MALDHGDSQGNRQLLFATLPDSETRFGHESTRSASETRFGRICLTVPLLLLQLSVCSKRISPHFTDYSALKSITMYSINNDKGSLKVTPNILPCKISFNGPVNASERYWAIKNDESGQKTTYFRGRKLVGRDVSLPEGYSGE